jgi:hypothetical protein
VEKFCDDPNGPMPGTKKNKKDVVAEYFKAAAYPLDDWKIDLKATYSGEQIQGYWKAANALRWKPVEVADLDTRIIVGQSSQMWYGATWIFVPETLALDLDFHLHPMTTLTWSLNGKTLALPAAPKGGPRADHPVVRQNVTLAKGWNQVMFRGFNVGYTPFRAGVTLAGPQESLWKVKLSGTPRAE